MKIEINPVVNKNKDFKGHSVKMPFWSSDVCLTSKLLSQK